MHPPRFDRLLMVALSVTTVAQAAWLNAEVFGGVHHEGDVAKRQDDDTTTTPDAGTISVTLPPATSTVEVEDTTTTEETAPTTTSVTTTAEEQTTITTEQTTTTPPPEETSTPTTTTEVSTPTTPPPPPLEDDTTTTTTTGPSPPAGPTISSDPTDTSTTGAPTSVGSTASTTTGGEISEPSTTLSSFTSVVTEVQTITADDGNGQRTVYTTSSTRTTTGAALITGTPGGQTGSGMTPETKNIIIGVTVGIGGAIILGVGALMYWRLRNKQRNSEESEDLVSYGNGFGGPGTAEKPDTAGSASARSPFQSTLESYHAPSQANTASNF
ncbi:hypothetical protein DL769_004848 [Monosporascus sp. CRB-8-3]|nr:hypothetical protein DL769_004848 [Monosporascus sp. CRB-8-3]